MDEEEGLVRAVAEPGYCSGEYEYHQSHSLCRLALVTIVFKERLTRVPHKRYGLDNFLHGLESARVSPCYANLWVRTGLTLKKQDKIKNCMHHRLDCRNPRDMAMKDIKGGQIPARRPGANVVAASK